MYNIGKNMGERISLLLKEKGVSQKELAKQVNVDPSALSRYIKNEREPKIEFLIKTADFFKVSIDFLVTGKVAETSYNDFYYMAQMNSKTLTDEQKLKIMSLMLKYNN